MPDILLVLHQQPKKVADCLSEIQNWAENNQRSLAIVDNSEQALLANIPSVDSTDTAFDQVLSTASLVVSLGGDGTILRAANLVSASTLPILGVHLGRLGYLTEVESTEVSEALTRFFTGDYHLQERIILQIDQVKENLTSEGKQFEILQTWRALNDVIFQKNSDGHMVHLSVAINDKYFTTYPTDGLIISTPTGSTAYAFSVRGPIIEPSLATISVTPVSPHMLFDRTLVLDGQSTVTVQLEGYQEGSLVIDGKYIAKIDSSNTFICSKAQHPVHFVLFQEHNFHAILKSKFGLQDRVC